MITAQIRLDAYKENNIPILKIPQGDHGGREVRAVITALGERVTVDSADAVYITATRPDGESKSFAGTVNTDGSVTVPIARWMLDVEGEVECSVSVSRAGDKYTTNSFLIDVQYSPSAEDSSDSDIQPGDPVYVELTALISALDGRVTQNEADIESHGREIGGLKEKDLTLNLLGITLRRPYSTAEKSLIIRDQAGNLMTDVYPLYDRDREIPLARIPRFLDWYGPVKEIYFKDYQNIHTYYARVYLDGDDEYSVEIKRTDMSVPMYSGKGVDFYIAEYRRSIPYGCQFIIVDEVGNAVGETAADEQLYYGAFDSSALPDGGFKINKYDLYRFNYQKGQKEFNFIPPDLQSMFDIVDGLRRRIEIIEKESSIVSTDDGNGNVAFSIGWGSTASLSDDGNGNINLEVK